MESSDKTNESTQEVSMFQVIILVLSVYVICAVFAQTIFKLPDRTNSLIDNIDFGVCLIFLFDVGYRFYKADNKLKFLQWGWIDFVSSIPMVGFLRLGRLVRIVRIFRLLRAFRSTKILLAFLFRKRAKNTLLSVALITMILLIFSSIALVTFESNDPNSNIKTPMDAIWWGFVTITTVGYGDRYPVTIEGRIIAMFLMVAGVGLFGTFTAYVASLFVQMDTKKEESEIELLRKEIYFLREKIEKIDKKLS